MNEIDKKFRTLRVNFRKHGKTIAEDVVNRYHPATEPGVEICVFCNCSSSITREHVLPKWLVDNELHNTMTSNVNKQTLTYHKAVIPACSECNNSILAYIEKYISKAIQTLDQLNDCKVEDACNIVRWLEIIDYKLQVLDCRRKYIKYENSDYDRVWGIFPVSMMRHILSLKPWKAYEWLRTAQRRITVKKKNPLIVFKTGVRHFNFFTQPNEYVYVSCPMYNIALFYFFKKKA